MKIKGCLLIMIIISCIGCNKFLSKVPDNRTEISTVDEISALLGSAYPQASPVAFTEFRTDNVGWKGDNVGRFSQLYSDIYFFRDFIGIDNDGPENYWSACYAAIAVANEALAEIKKKGGNNQEKEYAPYKGEALLCRAYAHFMLVTFFSKIYDPLTAESDLGIPYVTVPEKQVFKQYERRTVAYVYEMIEQDLLEGIPLINSSAYKVPKYHFNREAAYAFAARFYLFKQEYEKVIEYANEGFPGNAIAQKMRPYKTRYSELQVNALLQTYAKATESANLLLIETGSSHTRHYRSSRVGFTSNLMTDEILAQSTIFGSSVPYGFFGTDLTIMTPKFSEYFVRISPNASIGNVYIMYPALTIEEVLFNRAEAYAELGQDVKCIADLNTFREQRVDVPISADLRTRLGSFYSDGKKFLVNTPKGAVRDTLINAILDFKRAEFLQEGMRWFDLMRHHLPITHIINDAGQSIILGVDDPRRVIQIPESATIAGLTLNPR